MDETLLIIITGLFSGGSFAAVFKLIDSWLQHRRARKDKIEDREIEKADKTETLSTAFKEFKDSENDRYEKQEEHFKKIDNKLQILIEADRLLMLDRIKELGIKFIERGDITFEERHDLGAMHDSYHNGLGGNGDADWIMDATEDLPLKK